MKQFMLYASLRLSLLYFMAAALLLTAQSCSKKAMDMETTMTMETTSNKTSMLLPADMLHQYTGLQATTLWELQQARAATARYRDIDNAIKDGYADINVVMPNMGHHFLKAAHLDGTFDMRKPEILVYNKLSDGSFVLVAVEYAVPIDLSPNNAPEGFTGGNDVWSKNTGFGLWLLHAWVWYHNPDGVFNPTNANVHTH
jgi:hypothetical protein